jgi:hypothetical protein
MKIMALHYPEKPYYLQTGAAEIPHRFLTENNKYIGRQYIKGKV